MFHRFSRVMYSSGSLFDGETISVDRIRFLPHASTIRIPSLRGKINLSNNLLRRLAAHDQSTKGTFRILHAFLDVDRMYVKSYYTIRRLFFPFGKRFDYPTSVRSHRWSIPTPVCGRPSGPISSLTYGIRGVTVVTRNTSIRRLFLKLLRRFGYSTSVY